MSKVSYCIPSLSPYGVVRKHRKHSGELILSLFREEYLDLDPDYLFLSLDGIPVPFRLLDLRGAWDNLIVQLDLCGDSEQDLESFRGVQVLVEQSVVDDLRMDFPDDSALPLIGYRFIHPELGVIGTLDDVDATTANVLLLLADGRGGQLYLPFVEEWIQNVDADKRTICYACPKDLLRLHLQD